jgi:hypothetical protein
MVLAHRCILTNSRNTTTDRLRRMLRERFLGGGLGRRRKDILNCENTRLRESYMQNTAVSIV